VVLRRLLPIAAVALVVIAGVTVLSVRSRDEPSASTTAPGRTEVASATPSEPVTPTLRARARHSGSVLIVGDSLLVGANKFGLSTMLAADGREVEVDADEGRSTTSGIAAVRGRPTVPGLAVVELGTNPSAALATFAEEVQQMLGALFERGALRVVWLTPHHRDDDRYNAKAQALLDAARNESRLVLADWHEHAAGHEEWMRTDGLHYTDAGYAIFCRIHRRPRRRQRPRLIPKVEQDQ
jgi:lysophospholipase L1-like esterase